MGRMGKRIGKTGFFALTGPVPVLLSVENVQSVEGDKNRMFWMKELKLGDEITCMN